MILPRFSRLLVVILGVSVSALASAQQKNGFDLGNALVEPDTILHGGPPRDGIPALSDPAFVAPSDTLPWRPDDLLMTLDLDGRSYAYPVGIMNWHEIVNHEIDGRPVLVTFCPLCGTGMIFDPVVDGETLTFGVSGLLHNSDLLMYDHQTLSLWSQIPGKAIAGPMAGKVLDRIRGRHELWGKWLQRDAGERRVLSTETGYERDYLRSPYGDYDHSDRLYFPVSEESRRYHPKTWVIGLEINGEARVWPFPELDDASTPVKDVIGEQPVTIHYDPDVPSAWVIDDAGNELAATRAFWFAWYTFHPETTIFRAQGAN
jgi:hypothetical protein